MRRQFVLDKHTSEILDELAADRAGNRSLVVREAIQVYADVEARLDEIEADPAFQAMMARSAADIRGGRVVSQRDVEKRILPKKRKRQK